MRLSRAAYILLLPLFAILIASGCSSQKAVTSQDPAQNSTQGGPAEAEPLRYVVDLNDRADDLFKVTLTVDDLGAENAVYQFASTAPGTYQVMNMGRFVRSFTAIDADGNEIETEYIAPNQYRISDPASVTQISYAIVETWDTLMPEDNIMIMGGTSIEEDHVMINGQAVFGYPTGMQDRPIEIRLEHPDVWIAATALTADADGWYRADNYDQVVDSPILIGNLSQASFTVGDTEIEIFVYSETGQVQAESIKEAVVDIIDAADEFLNGLPVDRYVFLFHFGDPIAVVSNLQGYIGAWEHSYSSGYVMSEANFEQSIQGQIPSIVAHEFFHIVTPLNIHSEVIAQFNFVQPVASEHLWLYEGTTEWVAQTMQLRAGLITLDEYLGRMSDKLQTDDTLDKTWSLSRISLESFTPEGQEQYYNIYQRGAIVSTLLDIRLLELSGGERGLREVLIELAEVYGTDRAFDEATFFETFAEMTYPEISEFFDDYVRNANPLPLTEYFAKIGIQYIPEVATGEMAPLLGLGIGPSPDGIQVTSVSEPASTCGYVSGDILVSVNDEEFSIPNIQASWGYIVGLGPGEAFDVTISRDGDEQVITCEKELIEQIDTHVFEVNSMASPDQVQLRDVWLMNKSLTGS